LIVDIARDQQIAQLPRGVEVERRVVDILQAKRLALLL
jgi:hypothetical protein